jgi:hypothetical protein
MMTTVFQRVGPYEILRGDRPRRDGGGVFWPRTTARAGAWRLKLVPTGTDREAREILEAERWGAKLQEQFCRASGHVPAVYEHGTEWGYFYIAMEYLEGLNLSEVIATGPLRSERAAGIAIQLCRFLEAAHGFEVTIDGRPPPLAASRRSEASQHQGDLGRSRQDPRFRDRQGVVAQPKSDAQRFRQHRLPVARTARVRRDRSTF